MRYGLPIIITDAQIAEFYALTPKQLLETPFTSTNYNLFIYLMLDSDTIILSSPEKTKQTRIDLLRHFLEATDPEMISAVKKLATEFFVYKDSDIEIRNLPIHIAARNGFTDCVLAFLGKYPELYTIEDIFERNVLCHALSQPETLRALCNNPGFSAIRDKAYSSSDWSSMTNLNLLEMACVQYKSVYERSIEILLSTGLRIRP